MFVSEIRGRPHAPVGGRLEVCAQHRIQRTDSDCALEQTQIVAEVVVHRHRAAERIEGIARRNDQPLPVVTTEIANVTLTEQRISEESQGIAYRLLSRRVQAPALLLGHDVRIEVAVLRVLLLRDQVRDLEMRAVLTAWHRPAVRAEDDRGRIAEIDVEVVATERSEIAARLRAV